MTAHPTVPASSPTRWRAWQALEEHCQTIRKRHLRQIVADDARHGERFASEAAGIYFDYCKKRNVINIGIGGSELGPVMAYEALPHYSQRDMTFRFVSNVDGTDFAEATHDLDPEETLFIVCSKTFTTLETLTNAHTARTWSLRKLGDERAIARHFVAVSSDAEEVTTFGIDPEHMFAFWDWVGGRYSMDSAIGLSTMIATDAENFRAMLAGFHAMAARCRSAPFERNLPVLMGLLAIWVVRLHRALPTLKPTRPRFSPGATP